MEREYSNQNNFVHQDILPALQGLVEPIKIERQQNGMLVIQGRLLQNAEDVYPPLRSRFERLGYTPFIREHKAGVEVLAAPGVIERRPTRWKLNLALFIATILSVMFTGALSETNGALDRPSQLLLGIPFAATLLSILFAHEMGHFIVSRLRGAPASLPYFIPLPFSFIGTMGAVIVQREPFENRRTLLEVAIAGPLAGLVVAIPLLFYGLATSTVGAPVPGQAYFQEGNSILYALAKFLVFNQWLPGGGVDVQINAVAFGAWIGLLVTMVNLLPIGQLDGGHIAYALLGRRAEYLAYATLVLLLVLGLGGVAGTFGSSQWLVWVILAGLLVGPRHPAPLNDLVPLRPVHVALGILGFITFVLLFMPTPLAIVS